MKCFLARHQVGHFGLHCQINALASSRLNEPWNHHETPQFEALKPQTSREFKSTLQDLEMILDRSRIGAASRPNQCVNLATRLIIRVRESLEVAKHQKHFGFKSQLLQHRHKNDTSCSASVTFYMVLHHENP